MGRLDDKVAIITGAASGMGLAGAQIFAREGASVVLTDVVEDKLNKAVADIKENGGTAAAMKLDVADPAGWKDVVDQTVKLYGKINILVNNAGTHNSAGILDTDLETWNKVMNIDSTGVWLGMKAVIPIMQKNGDGSIVNTSSIGALVGGNGNGAAYSAAKGAVRSITKFAAQEFGKDSIRVNSVHPGVTFTSMTKKFFGTQKSNDDRPGMTFTKSVGASTKEEMSKVQKGNAVLPPYVADASDIGYAYLYLASDESKFVTGEELIVDGGYIINS
ncbi:SDR family oxidoreductase [Bombilactobacillus bombi]|uniref:SDR family NAD(P)-dependent oxidoreductase n=1 Tax=Bombilactobacillus bombi TaxID=1303590 RepID=UPI000E56E45A|nr:SDR family oxidoreductase [Bombilactobacillus bombi]AXX65022.1 SDR family oxidoreductase [Bombilactobacillus bombi]